MSECGSCVRLEEECQMRSRAYDRLLVAANRYQSVLQDIVNHEWTANKVKLIKTFVEAAQKALDATP